MTPLLDANGNPLPSTQPRVDVLTQLTLRYSKDPKTWEAVELRFEAILSWLQPHFESMHAMLMGESGLDARTADGQALVSRVIDLACTSLIMRRRAEMDALQEADRVSENGGSRVVPDEHA